MRLPARDQCSTPTTLLIREKQTLTRNTLDTLRQLKLIGMCDALEQRARNPTPTTSDSRNACHCSSTGKCCTVKTGGWTAYSKRPGYGFQPAWKTSTTATHADWNVHAWLTLPAVTGSAST